MTALNITVPEVGEKNTVADPLTQKALEEIRSFLNGANLDATNIKAGGVTEALLSASVVALINAKVAGLTTTEHSVSFEAKTGEFIQAEKPITITLPTAPALDTTIGVFNRGGTTTPTTVKAGGGNRIYGDFLDEVAQLKLQENQHVILQYVGIGSWRITAGEPLREAKYGITTTSPGTEVTASFFRPAFVSVTFEKLPAGAEAAYFNLKFAVGGVEVGAIADALPEGATGKANRYTISFYVEPAVKWKATLSTGTIQENRLTISTLVL